VTSPRSRAAYRSVVTAGEREALEGFLELYRGLVPGKVEALGDADARRPLVPSGLSLLGLVRHLAAVERTWFGEVLGGRPPGCADDWASDPADTVAAATAGYRAACAESRAVAGRFALAETAPHPHFGAVSLRWVYVHMIEETARHAGHADILRELLDGRTGFG
jgi:hypothetical protein